MLQQLMLQQRLRRLTLQPRLQRLQARVPRRLQRLRQRLQRRFKCNRDVDIFDRDYNANSVKFWEFKFWLCVFCAWVLTVSESPTFSTSVSGTSAVSFRRPKACEAVTWLGIEMRARNLLICGGAEPAEAARNRVFIAYIIRERKWPEWLLKLKDNNNEKNSKIIILAYFPNLARGFSVATIISIKPADDVTSCPPAAARFSQQGKAVWRPQWRPVARRSGRIYKHCRCTSIHPRRTRRKYQQVPYLLQRDRAAGWVSFGQKWKTWTARQYFANMVGLCATTVT